MSSRRASWVSSLSVLRLSGEENQVRVPRHPQKGRLGFLRCQCYFLCGACAPPAGCCHFPSRVRQTEVLPRRGFVRNERECLFCCLITPPVEDLHLRQTHVSGNRAIGASQGQRNSKKKRKIVIRLDLWSQPRDRSELIQGFVGTRLCERLSDGGCLLIGQALQGIVSQTGGVF
jgi:hypothetical protein